MSTNSTRVEAVEDAIPQGLPNSLQTGHEQTTIQARVLVASAGLLVAVVIVCQVVLGLWLQGFKRKKEPANALYPGRPAIDVDQFPQPRLQKTPPIDLMGMKREEGARISSYGWVDKKAGIARIPVDRAMEILAQNGLPKVAAPPPTAGAPPQTTIPPARKREEAGPEESQPAPRKRVDQLDPESKRGGNP
jgi:hypothetical protein